jgi:formate-dependent nitrite reductase membrane component NrfD
MTDTAPLSVRVMDERDVTYYDLPSVKSSLWGGLVSGYMFIAGVGGSAQIIATAATLVGDRTLAPIIRNGRYIALGATVLGGPLLMIDLHTPQRWYNMLRIFRKTSPMSIGTWVLMSFGSLSAVLAAAQFASDHGHTLSRTMQTAIKLLEVPAALAGMAMSTYTGALLSATSTPLWAAAPRRIAAVFGASAMASSAAALTIVGESRSASDEASRVLDRIALTASAVELFLLWSLRQRFREEGVDGALNETGWGLAYDFGVMALGAGVPMLHHVGSVIEPKPAPRRALMISFAVLAGGFLLRHVLLRAGNTSAKRPKDYFRFTGRAPQ